MTIKPGNLMATALGYMPTMLTDGRRMRVVWVDGNGDGDSSSRLIERCQTTHKGHPTWKIFCGDIANPIIRGMNEPPHYVYLDDRACYAVWASSTYTKQERRAFWPFDFDNRGHVKAKRMNRGRPAYLDDSCTEYAKGTLRNKTEMYEFIGAPALVVKKMKTEGEEAEALTTGTGLQADEAMKPVKGIPIDHATVEPLSPQSTPLRKTEAIYPSRPKWNEGPMSNARILYKPHIPTFYKPGPIDGSLQPLGMAQKAMQGSPYFEKPCATFRSRPRPRGGDLAARLGDFNSKRTREEAFPMDDSKVVDGMSKKKKVVQTSEWSVPGMSSGTPEPMRVKLEEDTNDLTPLK